MKLYPPCSQVGAWDSYPGLPTLIMLLMGTDLQPRTPFCSLDLSAFSMMLDASIEVWTFGVSVLEAYPCSLCPLCSSQVAAMVVSLTLYVKLE